VHVVLHLLLWQVMASAFYCVVKVHVHQLEHECEATRGLVVEYLVELDDLGVGGKSAQGLDFPEVIDLRRVSVFKLLSRWCRSGFSCT
jgi:hypothetical protein